MRTLRSLLTDGFDGGDLLSLALVYLAGWIVVLWPLVTNERAREVLWRRIPF